VVAHTHPTMINTTIKIPTRLSATAILRVKYFSYTNLSEVHVYKIVNDERKLNETGQTSYSPTTVTLPVFSHNVTVSGTEAAISISINTTSDLSHYDIIISNDKGEHVLSVEVVPKGKVYTQLCFQVLNFLQ